MACVAVRQRRCKLSGHKKGTRQWWVFRRCLCPGQQHISSPRNFGRVINKDGNSTPTVHSRIQLYNGMLEPRYQRMYPSSPEDRSRRSPSQLQLGCRLQTSTGSSHSEPVPRRTDMTPTPTKSLARWCRHLNIAYKESFEIHGDLYKTWSEHYEDRSLVTAQWTRRDSPATR